MSADSEIPFLVLETARLAVHRIETTTFDPVNVIAGAILADRIAHREQLEAEGWRFVEPGYMALPRDRREAELMSIVADAYLKQPKAETP